MMKAIYIHTTYGKSYKYLSSEWVSEDYAEEYKASMIKMGHNLGWLKEFNFTSPMKPYEISNDPTDGTIRVVTRDGVKKLHVRG